MRALSLHLAVLALLLGLHFVLPAYHHANLARIMVLAVFAMGYNIAFGYTGLLSLGHALLLSAGMFGAGLLIQHFGLTAAPALLIGTLAGAAMAAVTGLLALRTTGVSLMIVTLMFAQAGYLTLLYFGAVTGGDEGFPVPAAGRVAFGLNLAAEGPRYLVALGLFAVALMGNLALVRSRFGRVMVAMRENEERSRMLGYNPFAVKLGLMALSGLYAGAAGAFYGVMFGYVGATFATIPYSILPLLYVLLGGAGVTLGPLLGAVLMFYLIDLASSHTTVQLAVTGGALLVLVLFAPKGILGSLRERGLASWLP
ncbi:branched-chain amino acid ABC transporter permease [Gemmobacter lutimaris]|uniref:Branched-chain amino acid ABC transporter permease n=1 Tax=Gemmobacter lutimaris TaxID=2306023 RepID=A0A398BVU8_9RHOB|nr:branched-chain amino acid ABC transporter permease [Gemmobacter lutimaris]RID93041.1 branched-chain amino acid ABC transporter permease [Gemmobacter lutimaris]